MLRIRHCVSLAAAVAFIAVAGGCGDAETAATVASQEVPALTTSAVGIGPLITLDTLPSDPAAAGWARVMLTEGLAVMAVDAGNPKVAVMLEADGPGVGGSMVVLTTPEVATHARQQWAKRPRATVLVRGTAVTALAPAVTDGNAALVQRLLNALRADGWR